MSPEETVDARIARLDQKHNDLDRRVTVMETTNSDSFAEVRDDIKGLRNVLVTFAFSVAGAAIVFAIGVLKLLS